MHFRHSWEYCIQMLLCIFIWHVKWNPPLYVHTVRNGLNNHLNTNSPSSVQSEERQTCREKARLCLFSSSTDFLGPTEVRLEHFIEQF